MATTEVTQTPFKAVPDKVNTDLSDLSLGGDSAKQRQAQLIGSKLQTTYDKDGIQGLVRKYMEMSNLDRNLSGHFEQTAHALWSESLEQMNPKPENLKRNEEEFIKNNTEEILRHMALSLAGTLRDGVTFKDKRDNERGIPGLGQLIERGIVKVNKDDNLNQAIATVVANRLEVHRKDKLARNMGSAVDQSLSTEINTEFNQAEANALPEYRKGLFNTFNDMFLKSKLDKNESVRLALKAAKTPDLLNDENKLREFLKNEGSIGDEQVDTLTAEIMSKTKYGVYLTKSVDDYVNELLDPSNLTEGTEKTLNDVALEATAGAFLELKNDLNRGLGEQGLSVEQKEGIFSEVSSLVKQKLSAKEDFNQNDFDTACNSFRDARKAASTGEFETLGENAKVAKEYFDKLPKDGSEEIVFAYNYAKSMSEQIVAKRAADAEARRLEEEAKEEALKSPLSIEERKALREIIKDKIVNRFSEIDPGSGKLRRLTTLSPEENVLLDKLYGLYVRLRDPDGEEAFNRLPERFKADVELPNKNEYQMLRAQIDKISPQGVDMQFNWFAKANEGLEKPFTVVISEDE